MSNATAIFRQIVQDGLNIRADARREAALEAQARKLRLIINENHTAKTTHKAAERRQEKPKAKPHNLKRRQEKRAERAAESAYCTGWYCFMLRVFIPMFVAVATIALSNRGVLPLNLAAPCAIIACLIGITEFVYRYIPHTGFKKIQ